MPKDVSPDAKPLLLIHGFACGKRDWGALPRLLAAKSRRRVIVMDNRGVGDSDATDGPYSIAQLAADALGVMDAAEAPVCGVLGISMGGLIAQSLALSHPERLSALILGCTSHGGREAVPNPPEFVSACAAWANEPIPNESPMVDAFLRYTLPMPDANHADTAPDSAEDPVFFSKLKASFLETRRTPVGLQGQLGAMMRFNSTSRLHEISCLTRVITGDRDAAVPMQNSQSLARRILNAELVVMEGAGHFWWARRTVDVAKLLAEALLRSDEQWKGRSKA
jgi:pimeloyl-ACP methyl ester carboxylesterase